MTYLLASSLILAITLFSIWMGWWFLRRCWRVVKIYAVGYTWCSVVTLKGDRWEGWVSITHLRSIHGHLYQECPLFKIKTKDSWLTVNPGEFESINEILGLVKVAWRGGSVGI